MTTNKTRIFYFVDSAKVRSYKFSTREQAEDHRLDMENQGSIEPNSANIQLVQFPVFNLLDKPQANEKRYKAFLKSLDQSKKIDNFEIGETVQIISGYNDDMIYSMKKT